MYRDLHMSDYFLTIFRCYLKGRKILFEVIWRGWEEWIDEEDRERKERNKEKQDREAG